MHITLTQLLFTALGAVLYHVWVTRVSRRARLARAQLLQAGDTGQDGH